MIVVDDLRPCGAPWPGGIACHMASDTSVDELLEFAMGIGLQRGWLQRGTMPHFDLSPRWRERAIAAGARPVDRLGMVAALHRWRAEDAAAAERHRAWIEAGPDRGPHPDAQ